MSWPDGLTGANAVTIILLMMAAEIVALTLWRRVRLKSVLLTILPGAAILLALRAALNGAPWIVIGFWLTVSLPLHIADLRHRRLL